MGEARIGCCFCLCAILFALACRCTFLVSAHASQGASPDLIVVLFFCFFLALGGCCRPACIAYCVFVCLFPPVNWRCH